MGAAITPPILLLLLIHVQVLGVHIEGRDIDVLYDAAVGSRQGAGDDRFTLERVTIHSLIWASRAFSPLRGIHRIHSREHTACSI